MNAPMLDSHFQTRMTRGAQRDKIRYDVGIVLVFIIASWVNVMNVKTASTGASDGVAASTAFVSFVNQNPDVIPKVSMRQTLPSFPVRAVFTNRVVAITFYGAEFASIFKGAREGWEANLAMKAHAEGVLSGEYVFALTRAAILLVGEEWSTANRALPYHLASLPSRMTVSAAKRDGYFSFTSNAAISLKRRTTMSTNEVHHHGC